MNVTHGKNGRHTHNVVCHGWFEMILKVSESNSVKSTPAFQTKCSPYVLENGSPSVRALLMLNLLRVHLDRSQGSWEP